MRIVPSRILVSVPVGLVCAVIGALGILSTDTSYMDIFFWIVTGVGVSISIIGLGLGWDTQPMISIESGENTLLSSHPSFKSAFVLIPLGILLLLVSFYLTVASDDSLPLVLAGTLLIGAYLCLRGIMKYWLNHCTTYYVTSEKVAFEYRLCIFFGDYHGIPVDDVNSVRSSFSFIQKVTNRGDVRVATGGGRDAQVLEFYDVDNPNEVRRVLDSVTLPGNLSSRGI